MLSYKNIRYFINESNPDSFLDNYNYWAIKDDILKGFNINFDDILINKIKRNYVKSNGFINYTLIDLDYLSNIANISNRYYDDIDLISDTEMVNLKIVFLVKCILEYNTEISYTDRCLYERIISIPYNDIMLNQVIL